MRQNILSAFNVMNSSVINSGVVLYCELEITLVVKNATEFTDST